MPHQLRRAAKRITAALIGFVFLIVGVGIVLGMEIYWRRVVAPEHERMAAAVSVSADKLDPQNDGKLVHVTGPLSGAEKLTDPDFGVAVTALRLRRRVWLRQWQQRNLQSKSKDSLVDMKTGKTIVTLAKSETYNYSEVWSEKVISSRDFYNRGHDNPARKEIPDRAIAARNISLGAFMLSPELAEQIDNFETVSVDEKNLSNLPTPLRSDAKLAGGEIYLGTNPQKPAIGDAKVRLEFAPAATASVIARQNNGKLLPFTVSKAASVGTLRVGSHSIQEMTQQVATTNRQQRILCWCLGGFAALAGSFILLNVAKAR